MKEQEEHLNNLAEIRSIMEKTTSFISLSGLSGIFAGLFAIIGAFIAFYFFDYNYNTSNISEIIYTSAGTYNISFLLLCIIDGTLVLLLALASGIFFSAQKAKKSNTKLWDKSAKRLISNLLIPLITGGLLILIFIYQKQIVYISSLTLIFYGLALVNASKFTISDIKYLGYLEIFTGLIATFFLGYGLIFWTIGFGLLHIIYGILMYYKYDKKPSGKKNK